MAEISRYSAYRSSLEKTDVDGNQFTTDAEPFLYNEEVDNIEHTVVDGENWWDLAHMYWDGITQAASYWRAIAEFQPDPVTDPFVPPKPGTVVFVPSRQTFETKISSRRIGISF